MKRGIGSTAGSILAMRAGVAAQEAASKTTVRKSEAQLRNEEFLAIKAEHEKSFITVEVPNSDYERAISGQATKLVEMPRDSYEKRYGISDLRKLWSLSVEDIQAKANDPMTRIRMVDGTVRWPRTSSPIERTPENIEKASQQAETFLEPLGLTDDEKVKVILFVCYAADGNSFVDIMSPDVWRVGYERLQQLGIIQSGSEQAQAEAPIQIQEPSLTEFRTDAEARWYSIWEQDFNGWLDSMARAWSFYPTKAQAYAAIDRLMTLESYGSDRFNEARRRLTKDGTFRLGMLTEDEQLAEKFEKGMSSAEYAQAFNRIKYGN